MKHISYTDVEGRKVEEAGAHGVTIRTVIGEPDGAPNFSMRVISFEKEGATPNHSHPWEHEVFILKGKGRVEVTAKWSHSSRGTWCSFPPTQCIVFRATVPWRCYE